jgi:hypothetical protein
MDMRSLLVMESLADVVACVTSTLTLLQTHSGCVVQRIRTDRGSVFFSLSSLCLAHGTIHETTAGYTPQSNGAGTSPGSIVGHAGFVGYITRRYCWACELCWEHHPAVLLGMRALLGTSPSGIVGHSSFVG